ncbi:MAG TPA: flagellar basal-body MS-ring/collar protein FliF [Woeseiaceae bacterium]|nr:flagellar basal-body MS-ring/collar protein FliF [Woeseiaceae bacterium]
MDKKNAIQSPQSLASNLSLGGVLKIPAVHQVLLLIGVAAAVAAGFAIVLWSQTPGFTTLYGNLEAGEEAEIVEALRTANIKYKLDETSGAVLVPESSLHNARMQLAAQGLPGSATAGMDLLQDQSSFGVSQFMENARYQHALEAELARTISSLGNVRDARVHLAVPKQSSFIRQQKTASASVLVHLYRGRLLEEDEAMAIVNLVAASVPDLMPKNVTVVDQYGSLLSSGQQSMNAEANNQFKYTRKLEATYKARIEDMLTPIVGPGRIRAQVVADVDFTVTEKTRESYDPENSVVRSERVSEDLRMGNGNVAVGVPGALSNQPPEATGDELENLVGPSASDLQNSTRTSTRNYEVDRTISHTRPQTGRIVKLSVAVLVDDGGNEDSASETTGLDEKTIASYTTLIKEAVGFNEARGDTVVVLGESFHHVEVADDIEPPAFWEKPVLRDMAKQVLGALLVLAIAFGIVRPMLRTVMANHGPSPLAGEYLGSSGNLPAATNVTRLAGASGGVGSVSFDEKVAAAKNITGSDPARVAQLVRKWVAGND